LEIIPGFLLISYRMQRIVVCVGTSDTETKETEMKTTLTEKLAAKVEKALERNQKAMTSAAAKGDEAVVQMAAAHHWRLARIDRYLEERWTR
jgi:hypothetical protein